MSGDGKKIRQCDDCAGVILLYSDIFMGDPWCDEQGERRSHQNGERDLTLGHIAPATRAKRRYRACQSGKRDVEVFDQEIFMGHYFTRPFATRSAPGIFVPMVIGLRMPQAPDRRGQSPH